MIEFYELVSLTSILCLTNSTIQHRYVNRILIFLDRLVQDYDVYVFDVQEPWSYEVRGHSVQKQLFSTQYLDDLNFYHDYRESEMLAGGTFKKVISCLSVCLSIF